MVRARRTAIRRVEHARRGEPRQRDGQRHRVGFRRQPLEEGRGARGAPRRQPDHDVALAVLRYGVLARADDARRDAEAARADRVDRVLEQLRRVDRSGGRPQRGLEVRDVLEQERRRLQRVQEQDILVQERVALVAVVLAGPRVDALLAQALDDRAPDPAPALARRAAQHEVDVAPVAIQRLEARLRVETEARAHAVARRPPTQPQPAQRAPRLAREQRRDRRHARGDAPVLALAAARRRLLDARALLVPESPRAPLDGAVRQLRAALRRDVEQRVLLHPRQRGGGRRRHPEPGQPEARHHAAVQRQRRCRGIDSTPRLPPRVGRAETSRFVGERRVESA